MYERFWRDEKQVRKVVILFIFIFFLCYVGIPWPKLAV